MARMTGDGRVISSGKGMFGLRISWKLFQLWTEQQLRDQATTARTWTRKVRTGGDG